MRLQSSEPVVSVIVPCFRQAQFLTECHRSLRAQALPDWEMVVVNDGSPDDTVAVVESLRAQDRRVRLVDRANGGPSQARNAGMEASRGRYIQFLDADDLLTPLKLSLHAAALEAQPGIDLIYGNAWYFEDADPSRRCRNAFGSEKGFDWIAAYANEPGEWLPRLLTRNLMPICAPVFRRSLLGATGLMNVELRGNEDWEFWIRLAACGARFAFDPNPDATALIRLHSMSASQNRQFMRASVVAMHLECLRYLGQPRDRRLSLAAIGAALATNMPEAAEQTLRAILARTRSLEEWLAVRLAIANLPHSLLKPLVAPLLRAAPWHVRMLASAADQRQR